MLQNIAKQYFEATSSSILCKLPLQARATLTTKRKSFENETSRFCIFLDSSTSFDLNVLLVISYNKFED